MDIVPFLSSPIATAIMLIGSIVGIVWASIVFIRWITRRKRKNELLEKILDKIEQLPSNFPLNYTKDDMKRSKLDELIEYNEFLYKLLKNRYYEAVTEFEETRKLQPSRKTAGYIDESLEITSRFIEETVNEVLSLSEGKGFYLSETYLERVPIDLLSQF
ncbi:MAG: hypothetical protein GY771_05735, partial [bacterium]|nr:hypothetical protein [bacterium]